MARKTNNSTGGVFWDRRKCPDYRGACPVKGSEKCVNTWHLGLWYDFIVSPTRKCGNTAAAIRTGSSITSYFMTL